MAHAFAPSGMQVAFCDVSVRTISPNLSAKTWNLLLQPNDGFPIPADFEP